LDITWSCNVRADVPYNVLKEMKKAGCRLVVVGYESGDDNVLKEIRKGITVRQSLKFSVAAKKAGLKIFGCFMIGLKGDTKETVKKTFEFAKKINPDMAFFQQAVPFPGTEFYEWAKQNGYLKAKDWNDWLDDNGRLACIVDYPWLSKDEICKLRNELMVKFYGSFSWIAQAVLHNMHPDEIVRLLSAAKDYFRFLLKK